LRLSSSPELLPGQLNLDFVRRPIEAVLANPVHEVRYTAIFICPVTWKYSFADNIQYGSANNYIIGNATMESNSPLFLVPKKPAGTRNRRKGL
jgi:hypothetical protein